MREKEIRTLECYAQNLATKGNDAISASAILQAQEKIPARSTMFRRDLMHRVMQTLPSALLSAGRYLLAAITKRDVHSVCPTTAHFTLSMRQRGVRRARRYHASPESKCVFDRRRSQCAFAPPSKSSRTAASTSCSTERFADLLHAETKSSRGH